MHRQGFSHGHAHPANMLVQPGPLSRPAAERSCATPSFRLISFGRWRALGYLLPMESELGAQRAFVKGRGADVMNAMEGLRLLRRDVEEDDEDEKADDQDGEEGGEDDGWDSDATVTC